jgi:hypothetical protein
MSGMRAYDVGPDAGAVQARNFDCALAADFDDVESYLAYREHPAHRAVIERVIDPISRERVAAQYEL